MEYLSELRSVSILFTGLELNPSETSIIILDKLQRIMYTIQRKIKFMNGIVAKLLMFDKGLSFLCVFGLSGYKYTNDSERALKAASLILHSLKANPNVISCSVGVCTGVTFCGVVGHPHRCEYTVIGRKVNMAARLMVAYPNVVSCDRDTFLKSNLSSSYFAQLQSVELKGLQNIGIIRSFEGELVSWKGELADEIIELYPIVGREQEIKDFYHILDIFIKQKCMYDYVAITGELGSGKTRLLKHFAEIAITDEQYSKNLRISYVNVGTDKRMIRFWTLRQLVYRLLNLKKNKDSQVLALLRNRRAYPAIINKVLETTFPNVVQPPRSMNLMEEVIDMMSDLITAPYRIQEEKQMSLLFIDNIHNIDESSAYFLMNILMSKTVLLVYTMKNPIELIDSVCDAALTLSSCENTFVIPLRATSEQYHATISCQILHANFMSNKILGILRNRSLGFPGRMANILRELELNGLIAVVNESTRQQLIKEGQLEEEEMVEPIPKAMITRTYDVDGKIKLISDQNEPKSIVYSMRDTEAFVAHMYSADPSLHVLFDRLPDNAQLILKICSMVGMQFDSQCIQHCLKLTKQTYSKSIVDLFSMKFIMCAQSDRSEIEWSKKNVNRLINSCECPFNPGKHCAECVKMQFVSLADMETANSYIVNEFRSDFLPKLIDYYETKEYRCRHSCTHSIINKQLRNEDDDPFEELDLVNVIHEPRFTIWADKMKKIVKTIEKTYSSKRIPSGVQKVVTAKAFRNNVGKDRFLVLKEVDSKIPIELSRCCKPPSTHTIKEIELLLSSGIPYSAHRMTFERFKNKSVFEIVDPLTSLTSGHQQPYNATKCRCNTDIARGYKILMHLCQQHDDYKDRFIYYALKSIQADITLNEAFDARLMLTNLHNMLKLENDKKLQAVLEYYNSLIAFRTQDMDTCMNSCQLSLKMLGVDFERLVDIYKDRLNKYLTRSESEIRMIASILLHNCRCFVKLKQLKGAYDMALMVLQILPMDSYSRLEALEMCTLCCFSLGQAESIDLYYCNAKSLTDSLSKFAGCEPIVIRNGWLFMTNFFVLGRIDDAIDIGRQLIKLAVQINAEEVTSAPIAISLCLMSILKGDKKLYVYVMSILEQFNIKLWFCLMGLEACMSRDLIDGLCYNEYQFDINDTEIMLRNQLYVMSEKADEREARHMSILGCIYTDSILMRYKDQSNQVSKALEHFNHGVIELLKLERWSVIHVYCFSTFALYQSSKNIQATKSVPRLINAYNDICKRIPLFYAIFALCIAFQSVFEQKNVDSLLVQAESAAEFVMSPYLVNICRTSKMQINRLRKNISKN